MGTYGCEHVESRAYLDQISNLGYWILIQNSSYLQDLNNNLIIYSDSQDPNFKWI